MAYTTLDEPMLSPEAWDALKVTEKIEKNDENDVKRDGKRVKRVCFEPARP